MALNTGTAGTAGGDGDCTGHITLQSTFDCPADETVHVNFDILYRNTDCSEVPQSDCIIYYDNNGSWVDLFHLIPCVCYGYVYWGAWIANGCGYNYKAEYGGEHANFSIATPPSHKECRTGVCTIIAGGGTDTCATDAACRHKECVSGACRELMSVGTDTCTIGGTECNIATGTNKSEIPIFYIVIVIIVIIGILGAYYYMRK